MPPKNDQEEEEFKPKNKKISTKKKAETNIESQQQIDKVEKVERPQRRTRRKK